MLPSGFHKYKYLVDHEWTYDPDQPTVVDSQGHVNNWLYIPSEQDAKRESDEISGNETRWGLLFALIHSDVAVAIMLNTDRTSQELTHLHSLSTNSTPFYCQHCEISQ